MDNKIIKNRLGIIIKIVLFCFIVIIAKLVWLQIIKGAQYSQEAYMQQTRDSLISPKRGTIYDTNGKKLAVSATVETIIVEPSNVKKEEDKKKIAKYFSENFGLNYDDVLAQVSKKKTAPEVLMKKVEKEVTDKVRVWIKQENIKGIRILDDVKRYYPYGSLASHVLGFCGMDNQGLYGIEMRYESILKGVPGKIVTITDANGRAMPVDSERYINAEDGFDLVLSIDEVIQHTTDRYLEAAIQENDCKDGGVAIVMNPNTGEILAMSVKPDYNLNSPFTPNTQELMDKWGTLTGTEKSNILNLMWRNNAVSKTYEPGSTFKVITSAIAVEEKIVDPDQAGVFTCTGHSTVGGWKIQCWRSYNPHGSQSLTQGLQNSCNPVFIETGLKIGRSTFYKYLNGFGLMERTGIDLPSESTSVMFPEEKVGPVELATLSFGQRFEITPIQLISSISACVNGGNLMQPYIVKEVRNINGNIIEKKSPIILRQVISKETSEKILSMMESVVSVGTGRNAQIAGYAVGGKTGTGEQGTVNIEYVASFVGVAPVTKPEIVCLVALYTPKGPQGHQGGTIAAPVVQKIMSDTLKYLNITPDYEVSSTPTSDIRVPDITNKTITEALKVLSASGLKGDITFEGDQNATLVVEQMPKPGTMVYRNSIIKLYAKDNTARVSVEVPDLRSKTAAESMEILKGLGLNIKFSGSGLVASQDPPKGTQIEPGTVVRVELRQVVGD